MNAVQVVNSVKVNESCMTAAKVVDSSQAE